MIILSLAVGTFDLQGVSRSCIQAPSTGCAADFVDRLLMSPVDASLQITNAAGSQCYCATNNCNTQPLDATVPPTGKISPMQTMCEVSIVSVQLLIWT